MRRLELSGIVSGLPSGTVTDPAFKLCNGRHAASPRFRSHDCHNSYHIPTKSGMRLAFKHEVSGG